MSDEIVNIIPNIETRQKTQITPLIKEYANELRLAESSSFNSPYLINLKKELSVALMFNEMINEAIDGEEEHYLSAAEDFIRSLSSKFGTMSSSKTSINTGTITPIENPDPPSYQGPASTLVSVIEDSYVTEVPTYSANPDVIIAYEPGTTSTILTTEGATYVSWSGDIMITAATGSTELNATKLSATSFSVDAVINTDDILGQTTYLSRGTYSYLEHPFLNIMWEIADNFTGYKLYRNGDLLATIIEGSTNFYEDKDVERSVLYSYTIAGIDEDYGEIAQSTAISIKIDAAYTAVTLAGTFKEKGSTGFAVDTAYLEWEMPTSMEVGGWRVYKDGTQIQFLQSDNVSFRDTNIFPSTTPVYTVKVVYADGTNSPHSNAVSIEIPDAVVAGIYMPRLDSVDQINNGASIRVNWGSNGNEQDVLHDIYCDRKTYYDISGTRDVASDTVWTESYEFTPTDFTVGGPHYISIRATRDAIKSAFTEQIKLNVAGSNNDTIFYVEGEWTDDVQDGLPLPLDYIIDIGTEYVGDQTDVVEVHVTISGMSMNIEPYAYVRAVSVANNYRFDEPLNVTYFGNTSASTPRLAMNARYFGQYGQVVSERSIIFNILDPVEEEPVGKVIKLPVDDGDTFYKVWGTEKDDVSLFKQITLGTFTTMVKQEYETNGYLVVALNEPYSGADMPANTAVTVAEPEYVLYVEVYYGPSTIMTVFGKAGLEASFYTGSKFRFADDTSNTEYTVDAFYENNSTHPYDSSYLRYVLKTTVAYPDELSRNSGITAS